MDAAAAEMRIERFDDLGAGGLLVLLEQGGGRDQDAGQTIAALAGLFVEQGLVYKGKKPVHWCIHCKTALAEAEVEYEDYTSDTVWVKFPIARCAVESPDNEDVTALAYNLVDWKASVVIWTTTPWTIPGNRAIAYGAEFDYVLLEVGGVRDSRRTARPAESISTCSTPVVPCSERS